MARRNAAYRYKRLRIKQKRREERAVAMALYAQEIRERGYSVTIHMSMVKVNGVLDIYPKGRRWFYVPTFTWGDYTDVDQLLASKFSTPHQAMTP